MDYLSFMKARTPVIHSSLIYYVLSEKYYIPLTAYHNFSEFSLALDGC